MSDPIVLTLLTLPEDVSDQVREIAEASSLSVEQIVINHLKASLAAALPVLPPDIQTELDGLRRLSDDALWNVAREQMPDDVQERAHFLMDKNNLGTIADEEYEELGELVDRADHLMLRKANAAVILQERGYTFTQDNFVR